MITLLLRTNRAHATKNNILKNMPQPLDDFSDSQLEFATWFLENRSNLQRILIVFLMGTVGVILIYLFIVALIFFLDVSSHSQWIKRSTSAIILHLDKAPIFSPLPLEYGEVLVVNHTSGTSDFVSRVKNLNLDWIAHSLEYVYAIDGAELIRTSSFALPGDNYYVAFKTNNLAYTQAEFKIENILWRKALTKYEKERLKLAKFNIENIEFKSGDKQVIVDTVSAKIKNTTPFGYYSISVIALVYQSGNLAAVGKVDLNDFSAGETKNIVFGLGFLPVDKITDIFIVPQVHILDEKNIM